MDVTFISIHDLTPDARILYTSDSVIDILGYTPDEIVNHSAWEFFTKEDLPYAQAFQQKRVKMDKAAVLAYCSVKCRDGNWVGCECCFTIVYDVMIVCTSIYKVGGRSEKRAEEAPMIRRIFSSSPRDPRYHMLSHISAKFAQPLKPQIHEPRAALFLNRFTRTQTIMYATSAIDEIIGISAEVMKGKSFYYCIAENCLQDAIKCLENAKGNDSIAYLRFWFRDPRIDEPDASASNDDSDEEMTGTEMSEDVEGGGVHLGEGVSPESIQSNAVESSHSMEVDSGNTTDKGQNSRTSSYESTGESNTHEGIFGVSSEAYSSASSVGSPDEERAPRHVLQPREAIELEAVISCTSDGLVVCLRRARPMIPHPTHRPSQPVHPKGLFAAPWAAEPILPPLDTRPRAGYGSGFAPSLGPQGANRGSPSPMKVGGPDRQDFMNAIKDEAIFAWALTGINGSLSDYGRGRPTGESLPPGGLPIWASDPRQKTVSERSSSNGFHSGDEQYESASRRSPGNDRLTAHIFGDPGLSRRNGTRSQGYGFGSGVNGSAGHGTPHPW